jgi:hypothetical protein
MAEVNFLEMSDEDLLKHGAPVLTPESEAPQVQEPATVVEEPVVEAVEPTAAVEAEVVEDEEEELTEEEHAAAASLLAADDADLGDPPKPVAEAQPKPEKAKPAADATPKPDVAAEPAKVEPVAATPEDFQKAILAPFKANGREMQVQSAEEAITLMQQGANYNKKMAGLKPHLALVKQLEQNGLLSDEKIGFLIDLSKKNPEAIGKLIKDSGIDPLDLDTAKVDGYKPNTYAISDAQMDFDTVLDDLKNDEHFKPVIHDVANEWDVASQKIIADRPDVLRLLTSHKEMGVYDAITTEVERRKALGQLRGTPTLQAYDEVGKELEAAGKFAHLVKPVAAKPAVLPIKKTVAATAAKPQESQAVIDKRKAAASTATVPAKKATVDPEFNPLAMSDEDFAKYKPDFL